MDELSDIEIESIRSTLKKIGLESFSIFGVLTYPDEKVIRGMTTSKSGGFIEVRVTMRGTPIVTKLKLRGDAKELVKIFKGCDFGDNSLTFKYQVQNSEVGFATLKIYGVL